MLIGTGGNPLISMTKIGRYDHPWSGAWKSPNARCSYVNWPKSKRKTREEAELKGNTHESGKEMAQGRLIYQQSSESRESLD